MNNGTENFGDDWKLVEDLKKEYGLEDFSLTEDEKKMFFGQNELGDIWGLRYLKDEVIDKRVADIQSSESIQDCIESVMQLNRMVAHGEMFGGIHENYYNEIYDLYWKMKMTMLEVLGITDEDWHKYEGV